MPHPPYHPPHEHWKRRLQQCSLVAALVAASIGAGYFLCLTGERLEQYSGYLRPGLLAVSCFFFSIAIIHTAKRLGLGSSPQHSLMEEIKRAHVLLVEAESLSHTGAWEWDLSSNQWTFSDEWLRMHGTDRHSLQPQELLMIAHPDDRADIERAFDALRRGEGRYDLEHRIVRQDTGQIRYVRARGQCVKNREGEVVRVYGFVQDITAKRRAEAALRENEALLNEMLELLPVGVWVLDRDGHIVRANKAAQKIWGGVRYGGPERYGEFKGWWLDSGKEVRPEEWAGARAFSKGETVIGDEIEIACFDGTRKTIINSAVPITNAGGEITGVITVNQDITRRRRAEEAVRRSKEELEQRVKERTRELEQTYAKLRQETDERLAATEELRKRERLMQQQSRLAAMGEMLGNIAHQWRQPLNYLGLLIQQLPLSYELGELNAEYLEQEVEKAMQVILQMSNTINDFRDFLQPGKERKSFNLNQAVATTLTLFEATLKTMAVDLQVKNEAEVFAEGHQNEFSQVVMNIIMNARDVFRDRNISRPRLLISITKENGHAVVTITDNAGGIPEGIMDKIFDPYFTTKGPDKGTGIGLFMSKNIIEKSMAGRLTVRNTGEGAEFRIEI